MLIGYGQNVADRLNLLCDKGVDEFVAATFDPSAASLPHAGMLSRLTDVLKMEVRQAESGKLVQWDSQHDGERSDCGERRGGEASGLDFAQRLRRDRYGARYVGWLAVAAGFAEVGAEALAYQPLLGREG